jgi:hypothetical protein
MEGEDMIGDFRDTDSSRTHPKGFFSKERFANWGEGFERLSALEDFEGRSRTAAKEAAEAIERVVRANK